MSNTEEALTKLASELTDRVAALEQENAALRTQSKQASAPASAPVVQADVAEATCKALVKAGALKEDQVEQAKQAYLSDPEAAHRTILGVLDALAQSKSAAEMNDPAISGGSLVSGDVLDKSAQADRWAKVEAILGMN